MRKIEISELFLYKWRLWIGYGSVAIILLIVLIFASLNIPGGISAQEMQSVIKSDSINYLDFSSVAITNLPYHMLQKATLDIFGVTIIGIKLPSIIFACLSAAGMILILRKWFKPSIGILASLIAITTGQFIFIAQNGTPDVLYLFWPVWLIVLANLATRRKESKIISTIIFFVLATISLYTPLSIYIIIALVSATILHPHLRFLIKQITKMEAIVGLVVILIILAPLIGAVFKSPDLCLTMSGIPTGTPDLKANLASLGAQYLGFSKPGGTVLMTPFFELGSMLLIAFGIYHVFKTRSTAKSYIISLWVICLTPILILNPIFTSITFFPLVLLLASGLNKLLTYWYGIFPRNPYARIGGLVPIIVLSVVLVLSGVNRYVYGYRYDPEIVNSFSKDLSLIPSNTRELVASNNELPFYKIVAKHNKNLIILDSYSGGESFLTTHAANKSYAGYEISQIITNPMTNDSDRFYLYKKIAK